MDRALEKLRLFSTSPQSRTVPREVYLQKVVEAARWSEEFGYTGILVYTDNNIVDPWLVSQIILENTERLRPLVAVQPVYMHPYTAAKMVASFGFILGRKIYLNMLAGGFKNDLLALNDITPHDERYQRTTEYTLILRRLLESPAPMTFEGRYYKVKNLRMTPPLEPELFPGILISGSSPAGMEAAKAIGATSIKYPKPPEEEKAQHEPEVPCGIRVGIVARERDEDAWSAAHGRFPADRRGQLTHQLATQTSDSSWHEQLSRTADKSGGGVYWLHPFRNYHTFCPYLVGSYDRTATEVARYIRAGFRTFILDVPPSRNELEHTQVVFHRALRVAGQ